MSNNIGLDVKTPSTDCKSDKCPFHGTLGVRGNTFTGTVVSVKMHNTVTVEWPRRYYIPKYERYERRRTRITVHNPECIKTNEGDSVKLMGCRPVSKTKNFVVIENLGAVRGYIEDMEAREEAKVQTKTVTKEVTEKTEVKEDE